MGEKSIVLNRMYTGSYLSTNLGHEVINMFQADNGKHYLYLNAKGNFDKQGENVGYMLLVMYAGDNCLEVLALAKDLIPLASARCTLPRNYNKLNQKISGEQRSYIESQAKNEEGEKGSIHYGGAPLLELFSDADQQNVFISYEVGVDKNNKPQFFTPKDRMFLYFDKDADEYQQLDKGKRNPILTEHNFGSTTLHQYIKAGNNDYKTIKDLIDDSTLWKRSCSKVSLDSFVSHAISLIDICEIQDNENCFSNALAYFMKKYPKLWAKFFRECMNIDGFDDTFEISREEHAKIKNREDTGGRIDLLLRDSKQFIIIENKIKSGINKVKRELGNDLNQLDRYQNYVEYLIDNNKEEGRTKYHAFLLAPDYNMPSLDGKKFEPLYYSVICDFLKNKNEVLHDLDFLAFYHAMCRHSHKSESLSRYEDMKHTFYCRIEKYTKKD